MMLVRCALVAVAVVAALVDSDARVRGDSTATGEASPAWEGSASLFYYALPDDDDFPLLVAAVDRGALHLEARYNYEDLRTGSLFAGWNFSGGEGLEYLATPLAGLAFGRTNGFVAGLELSLMAGAFDLYAESEYVLDFAGSGGNFLYTWAELAASIGPVRAGLSAQRQRIFRTPLEIDRGLLLQLTQGPVTLSAYAFNIATESAFFVLGAAFEY